MARTRIKLNRRSIERLLKVEVRPHLEAIGHSIAAAAGPGHRVESEVGPRRARVAVITDTTEARRAEATTRNLTRAVVAGRR